MSSIVKQYQDEREFRALTGVSRQEFRELLPIFRESSVEWLWETYDKNKAIRQRHPGGGQKGVLNTMDKQLFFLLYSWKVYPTFDV